MWSRETEMLKASPSTDFLINTCLVMPFSFIFFLNVEIWRKLSICSCQRQNGNGWFLLVLLFVFLDNGKHCVIWTFCVWFALGHMQRMTEFEFILCWGCTQFIFSSSMELVVNIMEVQCIQFILLENSYFFLTDSVEDGEKLVKTALEAFGRIGTV